MKFIILIIQIALCIAKIADFTACAKDDNKNCASTVLGCCAQMIKFSDIGINPKNLVYYCLSYSDRVIWASKYVDEDDSNQEYAWQCQDIDDPASGAKALKTSTLAAAFSLLLLSIY